MLNEIRTKFVRGEEVKYISHLDLMKVFERALRRSRIPIAYSQGFNPRPQMVFGLPLPVGVTSEAEYADFQLSDHIPCEDFIESLNGELPKGFQITGAREKRTKDNIMASINMASYEILVSSDMPLDIGMMRGIIDEFLAQPSIIAKKEGKQGVKDIDIRPMIQRLGADDAASCSGLSQRYILNLKSNNLLKPDYDIENIFYLSALLSAGSVANLKAELLFSALSNFLSMPGRAKLIDLKLVKVHRTALFIKKEGMLLDPLDRSILQD